MPFRSCCVSCFAATAAMALWAASVAGQDVLGVGREPGGPFPSPEPAAEDEDAPTGLLGPGLHGRGPITGEYVYTSDLFENTHGGWNTTKAVRYRGLLDVIVRSDLDQLGWVPGGRLFFLAQQGHGLGPSLRDVGDIQYVSNLEAPDFTQMSIYRWTKTLMNDELEVHLGKQDANEEFASVEMAQDFIHSSFGFHPTIPMPTYPNPSMAAVLLWRPVEWFSLQGGVWDGQPDGRNWGFSGSGETFSMLEIELHYHVGRGQLPGDVHLGPWHHSGMWADLTPNSNVVHQGNHGFHLEWQQMLLRERGTGPDENQGLGGFFQYGWSPDDRNVAHEYFGAGLIWTGLIDGRDEDMLGLGVAHLCFCDRLPNERPETAVELFYKIVLTPNLVVQPDLQYVANPYLSHRDALAVGLRMILVL